MYEGHVDHISRHMVYGWAVNLADSKQSIDILICLDGADISRATASLPRPDVAEKLQLQSALHGFNARIPGLLDTAAAHQIEVRFADTRELIPNGERRFSRLDDFDVAANLLATREALSALFITHLPRSGSTLCMALLHRHPGIVVPEHYPFEIKPATYYARAARLLTEPGDHDFSASPTEFMRSSEHLGFNPFNHVAFDTVFRSGQLRDHFFERSARAAVFAALRAVSTDYYRHLAADQTKYTAAYFAEKCEAQGIVYGTRASDMALFPEAREIVLIRDPRDILCSSLSYFKQSFSEELVQNLLNGCETIHRIASARSPRTLVVKYEALVCDQLATLKSIARFLELDDSVWSDGAMLDTRLFNQHATTASPLESVGRWKGELSAAQRAACERAFADFLLEFGYDAPASSGVA